MAGEDDDVLKFLGLKGSTGSSKKDEPHPDADVLSFIGVQAPKAAPQERDWGGSTPITPEDRNVNPAPPQRGTLQRIREAIDPGTVIPAVASDVSGNIAENVVASSNMAARGFTDIWNNKPASGLGQAAMGTLGIPLSLVTGPVRSGENALAAITGNPEFAERAALVFPFNAGGPAAKTAMHEMRPSTRAADEVARIVGPENMPNVLSRLESNPRLRPIDTSDQLRMSGQGLIASPGSPEASRRLTENMRASAMGARDAVKGTYDEAMGLPPDAWEELTRLQNKAKSVGQAKIAPPLITAKPVDTSAVLADIDKALNPTPVKMSPGTTITPTPLQQHLAEFRQKIASGDQEVLTDADRLHGIQSQLRRDAEDLMANPSSRPLGRELMNYRNKLVDAIDKSAPGYKEGLEAYRDQKDIERAFQMGQELLVNSKDPKTAPGYLKSWISAKDRSPEEIAAARTGARQAIEQKMNSIKMSALDPARSGTDVPQIEFNRQKLETLFGKENTSKLFKHLQDERDIALTNNRGLGNSKTAETQAYQRRLEPREVGAPHSALPNWAIGAGLAAGGLTTNPTIGALTGLGLYGLRGGKSMYDWLARQGEISRNSSIADLITSNTPESRALLSIAAQRVGRRNKLNNLLAPP